MTEALETFAFNVAVARLYEFANAIDAAKDAPGGARREALEILARLSAPMMQSPAVTTPCSGSSACSMPILPTS